MRNGTPAGELAATTWLKSSFSGASGGTCVELAGLPTGEVALRNSRDPQGPALVFSRGEIAAFMAGVKADEFDDLTP